jgi:glycosyltransferase involved in cell wall biosynthesis
MRVLVFSPMVRFAMQHYVQCLANVLDQLEIDATFILPKHHVLAPAPGQRVTTIGGGGKLGTIWANLNPLTFYRIARELLRRKPDCVHILNGEARFTTLWLLVLCRLLRIRSILSAHDPEPHPGATMDIVAYWLIGRLTLRLPNDVVIHDESHRTIAVSWGNRIHVFPFPDISVLFGSEPRAGRRDEVLFFGRIESYKGLPNFVEIGLRLRGEARFVIAGLGRIEDNLLDRIDANPDIFELLHRYISDEEMIELFDRAKVVLLPYESATQSGIPAGAASRGAVPVGFAVGGLTNQIPNVGGYVAPPSDLDALEAIVKSLLNGSLKPDKSKIGQTSARFRGGLNELYFPKSGKNAALTCEARGCE